jgi:exonuclease VII large subunit
MTLSESFDPQAIKNQLFPYGREKCSEAEFLGNSSILGQEPEQTDTVPFENWQAQLLPLPCIAAEDSLDVLRFELERAHQLLRQQQNAIDALKQQLTNRELQLQHLQCKLTSTQQTCEGQAAKLSETDGICRGLKTQLRRQQQRVLQYRNLLSEQVSSAALMPFSNSGSMLAVNSDPTVSEVRPAVRSNPVSAWSAPQTIGLTGPLACYRELATVRRASSQRQAMSSEFQAEAFNDRPSDVSSVSGADTLPTHYESRIELPSFTRSNL